MRKGGTAGGGKHSSGPGRRRCSFFPFWRGLPLENQAELGEPMGAPCAAPCWFSQSLPTQRGVVLSVFTLLALPWVLDVGCRMLFSGQLVQGTCSNNTWIGIFGSYLYMAVVVKPSGIPFWLVGAPPILGLILVGIGMFTGGTGF